jgi:hypothetical protein
MDKGQPTAKYRDKLDKVSQERYDQKIECLGFDPYDMDKERSSKMTIIL